MPFCRRPASGDPLDREGRIFSMNRLIPLSRRDATIGALALAGTLIASPVLGSLAGGPALDFMVLMGGSKPVGTHKIQFINKNKELHVDIDIEIEVMVAFVRLGYYRHRNHEVWRDDRLVAFKSWTDDNGDVSEVSGRITDEGLLVEGPAGEIVAPADILPTSYWRADTIERDRLLHTQHGKVVEIEVTPIGDADVVDGGRTVPAAGYRLRGGVDADLWYDENDRWVKVAFSVRGADFEYALNVTEPPADIDPFERVLVAR